MTNVNPLLKAAISAVLIVLMAFPELALAQEPAPAGQVQQESGTAAQPEQNAPSGDGAAATQPNTPSNNLPDSPGAVAEQSSKPETTAPQPSSTEQPLGTAASEAGTASGAAASRPAGIAIAPAKQRQSRSLLIKIGALVGVGVAVGTVMALSSSSPSRPPNSQ
jgi:hypothetical protein